MLTDKEGSLKKLKRIQNGVMKPRDPIENGTTGGTGPLNNEAACNKNEV